jgi:hypothetical protein
VLNDAGSTADHVLKGEHSLRRLVVHVAKRWHNYHQSGVAGDEGSSKLVTNDTTPHIYAKVVVVTFTCSTWIIMVP